MCKEPLPGSPAPPVRSKRDLHLGRKEAFLAHHLEVTRQEIEARAFCELAELAKRRKADAGVSFEDLFGSEY